MGARALGMQDLLADIRRDEGFVAGVYLDHLGNPTAGYGHLLSTTDDLDDPRWRDAEALERLLVADAKRAVEDARRYLGPEGWARAPHKVQRVVANMAYQLGGRGLGGFRRMRDALLAGDWARAADEALDSLAARQTPARWQRHADTLRTLHRFGRRMRREGS